MSRPQRGTNRPRQEGEWEGEVTGEVTGEAPGAFRGRVAALVASIPPGRVASYGQLARLAGQPRGARLIGGILRAAGDALPWQRVVNKDGGLSTYKVGAGELQRALLEAEGVRFGRDGCCDLSVYGWTPPESP